MKEMRGFCEYREIKSCEEKITNPVKFKLQWLGPGALIARGPGSVPSWGTKTKKRKKILVMYKIQDMFTQLDAGKRRWEEANRAKCMCFLSIIFSI